MDEIILDWQARGYLVPSRDLIKTPEQIEGIRESGKITNGALDLVAREIKAGMTTEDINRLVDSIIPDAESVSARVASGSGNVRVTLKDIKDRDYSQMDMAEQISKAIRTKNAARAFVQQQSSFGGRRAGMPVQYVLQTTRMEKLQKVLPDFMAKVNESPVFQMSDVDLKFSKPEVRIETNRDKANQLGVSTRDIALSLQYGLS